MVISVLLLLPFLLLPFLLLFQDGSLPHSSACIPCPLPLLSFVLLRRTVLHQQGLLQFREGSTIQIRIAVAPVSAPAALLVGTVVVLQKHCALLLMLLLQGLCESLVLLLQHI